MRIRKKYLVLVLVYLIIGILFYPAWVKYQIGVVIVNQMVVYKELNCYYERLSELSLPNLDFVEKRIKYNFPEEGSQGDFMILQSKVYGYNINTQKNGKIYVLRGDKIITQRKPIE